VAIESGGEHRSSEPTFADVMNGFSFDAGRPVRRRRWGWRREDEQAPDDQSADPSAGRHSVESVGRSERSYLVAVDASAHPPADSWPPVVSVEPAPVEPAPDDEPEYDTMLGIEGGSASVRPYAWTRGRTRSGTELQLETLVSTSSRGRDELGLLAFEHRAVAELCECVHSVAEVAALLSVPLGVAKVLVGDMAGLGLVVVHQTGASNGDVPDLLALMERVLSGLRRL
jgi:hypothetical protein